MKTSARNQFSGKVSRVVAGAVNDEIELEVPGLGAIVAIVTHGSAVAAIITNESAESLGLAVGGGAVQGVQRDRWRACVGREKEGELTSLTPGTVSTVRAAWFPT